MDIAEVLDRVAPAERTVEICVDGTIAARLEALQARWADAVRYDHDHNEPSTAAAVAAQIDQLRAEALDATVAFRVRSIGASAWRRLVADYPPPADDVEGWRWDLETFPPAALAASCVDPEMSGAQANELAERISDGAWQKLFAAVLEVNMRDEVPKFGPVIGAAPPTAPSSTMSPVEESLGAPG